MTEFLDQNNGGFQAYLKSIPQITAIIGTGDNAKIYNGHAKQGVGDTYIAYEAAFGSESFRYHNGITNKRVTPVQCYCYGDTSQIANKLAETVKLAGELGTGKMWGDTYVQTATATPPDGAEISPIDKSDTTKPMRRTVLTLMHNQPTEL